MNKTEAPIQAAILNYLNSIPGMEAENNSGNAVQSGRADITACIYGKCYRIEVKCADTDYGKRGASAKQRINLEKWARAGAISVIAYCVDDVVWVIRKVQTVSLLLNNPLGFISEIAKPTMLRLSGRGRYYDVQNERWIKISDEAMETPT